MMEILKRLYRANGNAFAHGDTILLFSSHAPCITVDQNGDNVGCSSWISEFAHDNNVDIQVYYQNSFPVPEEYYRNNNDRMYRIINTFLNANGGYNPAIARQLILSYATYAPRFVTVRGPILAWLAFGGILNPANIPNQNQKRQLCNALLTLSYNRPSFDNYNAGGAVAGPGYCGTQWSLTRI